MIVKKNQTSMTQDKKIIKNKLFAFAGSLFFKTIDSHVT